VRHAGDRSGNTHADRRLALKFALDEFDAILDGANGGVVIVTRRGHAVTVKFAAIAFEGDKFNFCAAEIDANSDFILRGTDRCSVHGDKILSQNQEVRLKTGDGTNWKTQLAGEEQRKSQGRREVAG
jgi:hypothetical protein